MFGWFRSNDELLAVQRALDEVSAEFELNRAPRRLGRLGEARGRIAGHEGWLAISDKNGAFEVEQHLYLRPNLGVGLYVSVRGEASAGSRAEFKTGDEAFDGLFLVCGHTHEEIARVLDLEARVGLMELARWGQVRVSDAVLEVRYETEELSGARLVEVFRREVEVARSMIEGVVPGTA